jgi:hypothetical protein
MKFDDLETVLKECEQSLMEEENRLGFELNKAAYSFGWLRASYNRMYEALPEEMKNQKTETATIE